MSLLLVCFVYLFIYLCIFLFGSIFKKVTIKNNDNLIPKGLFHMNKCEMCLYIFILSLGVQEE